MATAEQRGFLREVIAEAFAADPWNELWPHESPRSMLSDISKHGGTDLGAKYAHTNLIARDWRRLATFYERVFGCTPASQERDLSGKWIEDATTIDGVHIRGIHLLLPGWGSSGPTLEIFQYSPQGLELPKEINIPGFGHVAFRVDDVDTVRKSVIANGGKDYGEQVTTRIPGEGAITFVYMADPEGNIIELQSWAAEESRGTTNRPPASSWGG